MVRVWKRDLAVSEQVLKSNLQECYKFIDESSEIECDSETTGLDCHSDSIICLQFGNPQTQFVVEWSDKLIEDFKGIFKTNKLFIFQNAKFDLKFLYSKGIYVKNVFDTFLAESVITTGYFVRKDLNTLGHRYLDVDISKEIRDSIAHLGLTKEVVEYSLDDVRYLSLIKEKQIERLKELDLMETIALDNHFVKALAYIEYCGIKMDKEGWIQKANEDKDIWANTSIQLNEIVISEGWSQFLRLGNLFDAQDSAFCNINWNSDQQVEKLMSFLGVNTTVVENGEEKKSVGVNVLTPQKQIHPIIEVYLKYSKTQKLVSTFGLDYVNYIHPKTGRIHTTFQQIMSTGRLSCGNKRDKTPNLQQIPSDKRHRECFIPDKGNKLICADYSGQEAVVFANKCLDENLLDFYDIGLGDMHSYVAKLCFPDELEGIEVEDVKELRPDLRQQAKGAGFAIQFGGNGFTIAKNLNLSNELGDYIYDRYMQAFPKIAKYFDSVSKQTLSQKFVLFNNITKRKSFIDFADRLKKLQYKVDNMNWEEYKAEKEGDTDYYRFELKPIVRNYYSLLGTLKRRSYNYPVQGSAADITKYACILLMNYIINNNLLNIVKIVLVVHDEIVLEVPENMAGDIARVTKKAMEDAGDKFFTRVRLKAEPAIGDYWSH